MGFHSFKNIGFSFVDAEAACRKWREKFTDFDPAGRDAYLSVHIQDHFVYTSYLGTDYRLDCETGVLEKRMDDDWTDQLFMNEALAVYHYMGDSKGLIRTPGNWVPESALDPVSIRSNDRTNPLFAGFAKDYSGRMEELEERCRLCGGVRDSKPGDTAWIFYPFPEIPVKLAFWEMDEEFPAQVKVFTRENAVDYLHYEAVAFVIADLFQLLDDQKVSPD